MAAQLSDLTGAHTPGVAGWTAAVHRRRGPVRGRSSGRFLDAVTGGVPAVTWSVSGCVPAPVTDPSNGPSNGNGPRASGAGRSRTAERIRRRRRGDRRRPRSGHLSGSGRRVLAAPVDCSRGAVRHRSWERWARLGVTVTVVTLLGFGVHAALVPTGSGAVVQVTVHRGDTLWGLAVEYSPDRDPRAVVDEIMVVNDLPEGVLPVGLVIQVPSSVT